MLQAGLPFAQFDPEGRGNPFHTGGVTQVSKRLSRNKLLATTLFAGVAGSMWYGTAMAQETTAEDEDSPIVIEEIDEDGEVDAVQEKVVVVGSLIAREEYTSIAPVQIISFCCCCSGCCV